MDIVNNVLSVMRTNPTISAILGLVLVLYSSLIAPKLPSNIAGFLDNWMVKLGLMFIIVFMSTNNVGLSLGVAAGLMATIQVITRYQMQQQVAKAEAKENEIVNNVEEVSTALPESNAHTETIEISNRIKEEVIPVGYEEINNLAPTTSLTGSESNADALQVHNGSISVQQLRQEELPAIPLIESKVLNKQTGCYASSDINGFIAGDNFAEI